jgi:hypothetical protein
MARRVAAAAIFVLAAIAAVRPIRSYDFFWHLATGRWILEHRALPATDPFTLASARVPWINGEWLYQVLLHAAERAFGINGITYLNAVFVGALFAFVFWFSSRERDAGTSALITALAFLGASPLLGVRPAAIAALFVASAIATLASSLSLRVMTIAYAAITIVWINMHPSALLAPFLAGATLLTSFKRWPLPVVSAAALLVNPFGLRGIVAPFELTRLIGSGAFVNAEWLPSSPELFPLLYATMALTVILNLFFRPKREDLWRIAIFVGLALLAVRHVRNQGLYFAALPLLIPPMLLPKKISAALAAAAIVPFAFAMRGERGAGVDDKRFPVRAVARLKSAGLEGNFYNVDQFGGYLEWVFYGERRVLTDGRNELFGDFIALDANARRDSRAWHSMIRKYSVDIAIDEYQDDRLEVVDMASGERRFLPPSLVRYRRRDWALIGFDDAAMVFARRAAFPADVLARLEYRYLVPDDPFIGYISDEARARARVEVDRARRELGNLEVVEKLEQGTRN